MVVRLDGRCRRRRRLEWHAKTNVLRSGGGALRKKTPTFRDDVAGAGSETTLYSWCDGAGWLSSNVAVRKGTFTVHCEELLLLENAKNLRKKEFVCFTK